MPSNFAAVTTSPRKGGDVGARHEALGSDAMRVEKEKVGRKEGAGTGSGKREGRRDRGRETRDGVGRREKEGASEEVG